MPVGAARRDRGAMGDVGKLTGASIESSRAKIHSSAAHDDATTRYGDDLRAMTRERAPTTATLEALRGLCLLYTSPSPRD